MSTEKKRNAACSALQEIIEECDLHKHGLEEFAQEPTQAKLPNFVKLCDSIALAAGYLQELFYAPDDEHLEAKYEKVVGRVTAYVRYANSNSITTVSFLQACNFWRQAASIAATEFRRITA